MVRTTSDNVVALTAFRTVAGDALQAFEVPPVDVLAWREALEDVGIELSVWRIHRRIGMTSRPARPSR